MAIDVREFRQTLGHFVTGVTVVAVETGGQVKAMTANAFTSLSLEPPLVLFCVSKASRTGELVGTIKGFSVNILHQEQEALASFFAGTWKDPIPPPSRFVPWEGGPRLDGCSAAVGCAVHSIVEGGDHWIVVGRVLALYQAQETRAPLVFFRGRYVRFDGAPGAPGTGPGGAG